MAGWDMDALLLRAILLAVQGGNWQRGGGKGQRPKPIPLPGEKKPASKAMPGLVQRLKNLGQIPADAKT